MATPYVQTYRSTVARRLAAVLMGAAGVVVVGLAVGGDVELLLRWGGAVLLVGAVGWVVYWRPALHLTDDGLQVVTAGLKADDWVIVNGIQRVRDAMKVAPKRAPMPGAGAPAGADVTRPGAKS